MELINRLVRQIWKPRRTFDAMTMLLKKPIVAAAVLSLLLTTAKLAYGASSSGGATPKSAPNATTAPEEKLNRQRYQMWCCRTHSARRHYVNCGRKAHTSLAGVEARTLKGSFYEKRGSGIHHAVDILAPRNTPVLAVEDGTIARLFDSKAGGHTIYHVDPSSQFVYYYAHLEKYAEGLKDGDRVKKGQVIGYVGTSGNAPPNTPHLHFSIGVMGPEKRTWCAAELDPYEVYSSH